MGRFSYEGGLVLSPEFLALVVGLSMYNATYIGEIVRSAFQSVSRGQLEAADALGLSRQQSLRLILFPQALRVIVRRQRPWDRYSSGLRESFCSS